MKKIFLILCMLFAFTRISYTQIPFCIQCPEVSFTYDMIQFTTPDGCEVAVYFGYRDVSCPPPTITHQVLIYGFGLIYPGCEAYTLDNSTLRDLSVQVIFDQNPMGWTLPNPGDCYTNYEFVSWGCMVHYMNYQGPGPGQGGSPGWFPCNVNECCIKQITVCNTNGIISFSEQLLGTVSCEEGEVGCTSQCPE